MPVGSGGGVNSAQHCELSPVLLALRDQDGSPSNSTIDVYDLTEK